MVTKADVIAWLEKLADLYNENKEHLTDLDSAIGDADHGINMSRGFSKVAEKLPDMQEKPISGVLKDTGMTLVSTVGGASGPLYGTFFMRAGGVVGDVEEITLADIVTLFEAGFEGIIQRGKAQLEDKTMVDAMSPALDALRAAAEAGDDIKTAMQSAADAAEAGMKATIPLLAKKGRASYLGERSVGHQDPGATSTHMLFKAASELWS